MKARTVPAAGIIGCLTLCPAAFLIAIDPPPDNAKPPAALLGGGQNGSEKLPYLGLSTARIPGMVAEHLGLAEGTGVIVRTVCPNSPADTAGFAVNDIILSLGGEPVAGSDAFSESIRARKAGDKLELEIIRKGKADKVEVILAERPAELNAHLGADPLLEGLPKAHADRIRDLMDMNIQGLGADFPEQRFENTFRMMRERMNRAFEEEIPPIVQGEDGGIRFQQNSTVRLMDNEGSIEIRSSDGNTEVTVRDSSNRLVWQGPWNSEEEKQAAPQEVRERIDRVNVGPANGKGFTFRFGKLGGKPDDMIEN
jgi:membrane-associated protease RseP (regulator of RpoE activity)